MGTERILIDLLRCSVCGETISEEIKAHITPETLSELYRLADKHDMAHIISKALWELGILGSGETSSRFRKKQMIAIYRYEKLNADFVTVCRTLEDAGVRFLPLKGSVIREYYPEPWMRTSCDIDILVDEKGVEETSTYLQRKLSYSYAEKSPHDISLYSPSGTHLELHHRLVEKTDSRSYESVLSNVWEHAYKIAESGYQMRMTHAMFYYFHIAHMAKHFASGGCGVKPILDLWILEHRAGISINEAAALLEQGGLLKFAQSARNLAEVWFSNQKSDKISQQMGAYILFGGAYGNLENRISVMRSRKKGKVYYVVRKIFLPFNTLKMYNPILEKHPWLMPAYQVKRWMRLVFCGGIKKSVSDIKINNAVSERQIENAAELIENVGLLE